MLIPITNPQNPYSTMMLELIGDHEHLALARAARHAAEPRSSLWTRGRRRVASALGAGYARATGRRAAADAGI